MLNETIWEKGTSTATRNECNCVKMVKCFLVVCVVIVITACVSLNHVVKVLRGWRDGPSFFRRLLSLDFLPFIDASGHVNSDTSRAKLLSTHVAHDCFGSLCVRHLPDKVLFFNALDFNINISRNL